MFTCIQFYLFAYLYQLVQSTYNCTLSSMYVPLSLYVRPSSLPYMRIAHFRICTHMPLHVSRHPQQLNLGSTPLKSDFIMV